MHLEGKAAISNKISKLHISVVTGSWYKNCFHQEIWETACIAPLCEMIPIEWVCGRLATGSFLKRNPGVKEV
jgi:phosphoribosylaminoimidazole carboxylase/phosphoribosylaminoimidazole-succinocarboxamide synthase